jgi:HAD superfamily hydrolase (TIGR01509 family)
MEMSYEQFRSAWALAFEPDDGVLAVVDSVRRRARTALFTNNGTVLLDAMPVLFPSVVNRFDPLLFSCALGTVKPEPEAFTAALARLNREPGDVLLVDDSPTVIDGAKAAGMHALLFSTVEALRSGLAAYIPDLA